MSDGRPPHSTTRRFDEMPDEDSISAELAVSGRPLRVISHLSLNRPKAARFSQCIPATEIRLPAARTRTMTLETMHGDMAKSKLRRVLRSQEA